MRLKVIIYTYTQWTFSSRQIAKALRENINYMWLSGMNQPDHRTINRFRGEIMRAVVEEVFFGVIEQLLEWGYVYLERFFLDGFVQLNCTQYTNLRKKGCFCTLSVCFP